ncbi:hypothetical protein DIZ76_014277 [Coccidioides immitis]|nr:hypothetical protein DIZ76_014277 [Coccidioides immitis]
MNPNYARLETKKLHVTDLFSEVLESKIINHIQSNGIDFSEMHNNDLALCSPTVLSFSLNEKLWGGHSYSMGYVDIRLTADLEEFAVENIKKIRFSNSPFNMLTIPEDKKTVIKSLIESCVYVINIVHFDDIIKGKGQGVIILLHGLPGVGKMLTAEAIAEQLKQPLYSISSGDLSANAKKLEVQLTCIFCIASDWGAVLLLDEADVYLQQ